MDTQPAPISAKPIKTRSISRRIHAALDIRVREAKAWDDCAKAAGLSPAGLYKARKRNEVQQLFEEKKAQYIQEIEDMKAPHKARAMEVARDLLDNSKSDAVKARMVEFLAGESKGMQVNVGVQVNNQPPAQGYEYAHPAQEVVVIRGASDTQSGADRAQEPDTIEHS